MTLVRWEHVDIEFKRDADMDALFAAIEPADEQVADLPPAFVDMTNGLQRRFLSWGWGCNQTLPATGRVTHISVYWDYTIAEDDERLMPLIAPFVVDGCKAVFDVSHDDAGGANFWGEYEMWEFDGSTVTRRKTEKVVEWQ